MRVLLSTIGSRGDVQPLVAFALALRAAGDEVRMCVPPDFCEWIEGLGVQAIALGPGLRATGRSNASAARPSPDQVRQMIEGTVADQFATISSAAQGCDVIVGATALQIAAPSIAERMGIPYVFAAYCPGVLPSVHHAPPSYGAFENPRTQTVVDHERLWAQDAQRWNATWGDILNSHRTAIGLRPLDDVRSYVLTSRAWLAADVSLAPWPEPNDETVFQTGAWILRDERALPNELESFLRAGDPPIYFGFGSLRAPAELSRAMIESARALGHRMIVSRGWAELSLIDDAPDCFSLGDVNHHALFKRVAAVVHHGGAGTTTTSALNGAPQVVIPQLFDQHYWAQRVQTLRIGIAHERSAPTVDSLTRVLVEVLRPDVRERAQQVTASVRLDGAMVAAQTLRSECSQA